VTDERDVPGDAVESWCQGITRTDNHYRSYKLQSYIVLKYTSTSLSARVCWLRCRHHLRVYERLQHVGVGLGARGDDAGDDRRGGTGDACCSSSAWGSVASGAGAPMLLAKLARSG
jgi:hypothetical protein